MSSSGLSAASQSAPLPPPAPYGPDDQRERTERDQPHPEHGGHDLPAGHLHDGLREDEEDRPVRSGGVGPVPADARRRVRPELAGAEDRRPAPVHVVPLQDHGALRDVAVDVGAVQRRREHQRRGPPRQRAEHPVPRVPHPARQQHPVPQPDHDEERQPQVREEGAGHGRREPPGGPHPPRLAHRQRPGRVAAHRDGERPDRAQPPTPGGTPQAAPPRRDRLPHWVRFCCPGAEPDFPGVSLVEPSDAPPEVPSVAVADTVAVPEALGRAEAAADADAAADPDGFDADGAGAPVAPASESSPEGSAWISAGNPGCPPSPVCAPPVCPDRNAPETTATSSPRPTTPPPASSRRAHGARRAVA